MMYNYCDFVLTSHESDSEQIRINFDEFLDFGVTICHRLAQGVAFSLTYRVGANAIDHDSNKYSDLFCKQPADRLVMSGKSEPNLAPAR